MLRESQQIALKVLKKLDEWGWQQKDLANKMMISPQQVYKIVKGASQFNHTVSVSRDIIRIVPLTK